MALLVVETGAGLPNSNSYTTVDEATAYHTNRGNSSLWVDKPGSATLELYTNPTDGQTVTIGSVVYTFKNTVSSTGQVLIGLDVPETCRHLAAAINSDGQYGVWYNPTTTPVVSAKASDSAVTVTALVGGSGSNDVAVSDTLTIPNRWTSSTLVGGDDTRERALMSATTYLDNQYSNRWVERRTHQDQALDWPRAFVQDKDDFPLGSDVVPQQVKNAVAYLALLVLQGEVLMPDQQASDRSVRSKSIKVGPIEKSVTYGGAGQSTQKKYREVDQLVFQFLNPTTRIWRA